MRSVLWFLVVLAGVAHAATVPNSSIDPQVPQLKAAQFTNASVAGTYVTVYTGDADGTKVIGLIVTSSDNAANVVTCQLNKAGTRVGGVAVSVPANAGFANNAPPVDFLSPALWIGLPRDSDGNPVIFLSDASDSVQCTFATALGASEVINVVAIGGDF